MGRRQELSSALATRVSRRWVRKARRSARSVGLILVHHEISETGGDWSRDVVPSLGKDLFRAQLEYLSSQYEVVPLREIAAQAQERSPGQRLPIALTFDDDLSCQTSIVAPMLESFGFPATFFLTGNSLNGGSSFWWQDLQVVADRDAGSATSLRRELADKWPWARLDAGIHELAQTIEALPPDERDAVAARLRELAGPDSLDAGLGPEAVKSLARRGFEVGFHTRRHYSLPTLDTKQLDAAMREGVDELEAVIGYRPTSIGYPHGKADLRVAESAQRAGFKIGVTGRFGSTGPEQHPLLLDRIEGRTDSLGHFAWSLGRVAMGG